METKIEFLERLHELMKYYNASFDVAAYNNDSNEIIILLDGNEMERLDTPVTHEDVEINTYDRMKRLQQMYKDGDIL